MAHKLLLADDSITIQKVVELILSEDEFSITSVGNGQEALEKLEGDLPDIILADIEMPELDGYELCRKVKSDPRTSHIPVILLAGAFESFDTNKAREVGAVDHVIKPFESSELIGKISAVLEGAPLAADDYEDEDQTPVMATATEDEPAVVEFDEDDDIVSAEIEEEPVGMAEAFAASDETLEEDAEDLWSTEDIPAVGEESTEWGDALEPSVHVEAGEEAVEVEAAEEAVEVGGAEPLELEAVESEAVAEFESDAPGEAAGESEDIAMIEEESFPGEDAGTEEMELAEDAEAVEEEVAEQIVEEETAPAMGQVSSLQVAPVTVSAEDVRAAVADAVQSSVQSALPSQEEIRVLVRESISAAVSVPDAGEAFASAARESLPDSSAILDAVREQVRAQDLGQIVRALVQEEIQGALPGLLKQTVEAVLWDVLPEASERIIRDVVEDQAPASLRTIFEKVAWETVPDVAERLINAEIERIKAQQ